MKKQLIAKLLVLAMVLAMVPATVLAASAGDNNNYGYYSVSIDTTTRVDAGDVAVKDGEATITAKVVNGTATVTLTTKAMETLAEQVEGDELVLNIDAEGATKVEVSVPSKALADMAEKTGADLTLKSSVVTISIPNEALATVFKDVGTVKISARASGSDVGFSIQTSGKAIKSIKGLKVEF